MDIEKNVSLLGVKALSKMQENAIEVIRTNDNVVLLSPTGTGKTLAFLLPIIENMDAEEENPQVIILSPTRELALQTYKVSKKINPQLRVSCLYGGRPAMEEHRNMNVLKPQMIIGTPGRVLDHMTKENFSVSSIKRLVVDEFDKMLELKFQDEMSAIVQGLPNLTSHVLVSATNSKEIHLFPAFAKRKPTYLNYLGEAGMAVPDTICHYIVRSPQKDKLETLRLLLGKFRGEPTVVFVGYRDAVARVGNYLHTQGFFVSTFHGGLEQKDREMALAMFFCGAKNVLVSTDLSARGLDIRTLRNVVHYHLPAHKEDYLHRCGRTGRWEDTGNSFLILGPEEAVPEYSQITFSEYQLLPPAEAPVPPVWTMLYIGKGKHDKISKGDIVGFLCKKGGARADEIGPIEIKEHYSFVSVKRSKSKQIMELCRNERIKKMSTRIELVRDSH